ncbi:MAG: trans-AT polyketide synthase/acyltransferase/oxidoreductase domain-containing protein [Psychromonas sp.]|jgi:trans-AT polyketide synthase/acyltransferase/oxidoreductase domain-containing protein
MLVSGAGNGLPNLSRPNFGAFNGWVKGRYLEDCRQRKAVDVALHLFKDGAYLQRINQLKLQGVKLTQSLSSYYLS